MTDPRHVLGAGGSPAPDVDLDAVRARAAQLRRHRRVGAGVAGALVVAAAGGLLALPGGPGSEELVPPVAAPGVTRTPSDPPSPATPGPTATPTRPPSPGPSSPGPPRPSTSGPPTSVPPATRPVPLPGESGGSGPSGSPGAPSPTAAVPFPADDQPDAAESAGSGLVLTAVTTGRQDGYDRVVYRFEGPEGALPGWRVA